MRQAGQLRAMTAIVLVWLAALPAAAAGGGPSLPEIRTHASNEVPACVTPERLMAFLETRNHSLNPAYRDIARHYKELGEGWRVRWDYAFFQMAIETNFLTYKRPDGRWGDVDPKQYNFAGIGTTGGGVPGNGFPDVRTGVLAQMQHLVAYSGERVAAPAAERTQLKQDDIIEASRALGRPVRFSDLSRRWAVDRNYGRSIEWAAEQYRSQFCREGVRVASADRGEPRGEVLPWLAEASGAKTQAAPAKAPKGLLWKATPAAKPLAKRADIAAEKAETGPTTKAGGSPKLVAPPEPARPSAAVRTVWSRDGKPSAATAPAGATLVNVQTSPIRVARIETADGAAAAGAPAGAATPVAAASGSLEEADGGGRVVGVSGVAAAAAAAAGAPSQPAPHGFDPARTPPSGLGMKPSACKVEAASFGGKKTLLIRSSGLDHTRLTALTVLDGFETAMTASYLKDAAASAETLGEFASKDAALAKARELCPES